MSFLAKILTKTITKVIKNLTNFEVAIDSLIDRFKEACPPKDELLQIVKQKNQIQGALESVVGAFTTVEATAETTNTIVTTVETAVKVIKSIPVPTSFPPGAGIPINVITILADSLDTLGDLLKGAKGALKVVPSAGKTITDAAQIIIKKLQLLDGVLNVCIEELAEGMNQAEKNELINEIGNVAALAGNFENIELNAANEANLLSQLSPNSTDPFLYQKQPTIWVPVDPNGDFENGDIDPSSGQQIIKNENGKFGYYAGLDWRLTIEYNDDNPMSFPQRRIRATNINDSFYNIYKGVNIFNIGPPANSVEDIGKYSYSTSVKVLIDEVKFNIDSSNVRWWQRKWNEENMLAANEIDREGESTGNTTGGNSTTPGNSGPIPDPVEILLPGSATMDDLKIPLPIVQNGSGTYFKQIPIRVNQNNQSVMLTIDTGGNDVYNENVQGDYGQPEYGRYLQGEVKVKINSNYNAEGNVVTFKTADRQIINFPITYNTTGTYTLRYEVVTQMDIQDDQGGMISLSIVS